RRRHLHPRGARRRYGVRTERADAPEPRAQRTRREAHLLRGLGRRPQRRPRRVRRVAAVPRLLTPTRNTFRVGGGRVGWRAGGTRGRGAAAGEAGAAGLVRARRTTGRSLR